MPQVWSLVVGEVSKNLAVDPVFGSGSASANWGTVNGSLAIDTTVGNVVLLQNIWIFLQARILV
jgi:hypothetical protein